MENNGADGTSAHEAAALLAAAESDRRELTERLVLPPLFCTSLGAAIGAQIATSALGVARGGAWLAFALPLGLAALAVVGAVQLLRFRRLNGAWVGGLASRVVAGTANAASIPYAGAFALATWAALKGHWWLVIVGATAGGVGYGIAGRYWWRRYRIDPVANGAGESLLWVVVLAVAAIAGLILVATAR